jgi:SulP family sulfate permease
VREVEFGTTYRSNVARPPAERQALDKLADRVLILRVNGFAFFAVATGLVERVRGRAKTGRLRFLLIDLGRVTGIDTSVVMAFTNVALLAKAGGFELLLCGANDDVRGKLHRGGVMAVDGVVRFEPDLDRGLERIEDAFLQAREETVTPPRVVSSDGAGDPLSGLPERFARYLERQTVPQGTVLIRQGEPPGDLYVLESGRLNVETTTLEGTQIRLSSVSPGVIVGEVAMYLGGPRTADVVAETACVVLRLSAASLERMETEDPELAAALHRRLAEYLAERVSDSLRMFDVILD